MYDKNGIATWEQYGKLILTELERHNALIEKMRDDISDIKSDIKLLNMKSGIWGAIGGTIPFIVSAIILFFKLQ